MVKKGALIGSLLATVGGVFFALYMISAYGRDVHTPVVSPDGKLTFVGLLYFTSFERFGDGFAYALIPLAILLYILGSIINYLSNFSSKKVFLIIGSILTSIGLWGIYQTWFMTSDQGGWNIAVYSSLYRIMSLIYGVGTLFYFIGLITYRKKFKAGVITGSILLALALFTNVFYGGIYIPSQLANMGDIQPSSFNQMYSRLINFHLLLQIIQLFILLIHFWMSAFVKKVVYEYEEDELSVEGSSAFMSYVEPQEKKDKGKKKKKSKKPDTVEFTF